MEVTPEFAEILGMFAADGCLQEKYICMWGNLFADKDYYDSVVSQLFFNVFGKQIKIHEKKSNSVYGFYACDKTLVALFRSMGFTNNKTYTVRAPSIIAGSENKAITASFLRGFADCDGCISFMKRKGKYNKFKLINNTYPRVILVSASEHMARDLCLLLNKLDIHHTFYCAKPFKTNKKSYVVSIRGETNVGDWMAKVGFHNPAQQSRYNIWKRFGTCPPKSTYSQRIGILKGELRANPALNLN